MKRCLVSLIIGEMAGNTKHSEAPLSGMAAVKTKLPSANASELLGQSVPHMAESRETVTTLGYCPFSGTVNTCQFRAPKTGGHIYKSLVRGYSQQLLHSFININKTLCHTKH